MHWLQRSHALPRLLSYRACDLPYNECGAETRGAAFDKIVLARLYIEVDMGTVARMFVHPRDSGEDMRSGGNSECDEPCRLQEGKLSLPIEYPALACSKLVARQAP